MNETQPGVKPQEKQLCTEDGCTRWAEMTLINLRDDSKQHVCMYHLVAFANYLVIGGQNAAARALKQVERKIIEPKK